MLATNRTESGALEREIERRGLVVLEQPLAAIRLARSTVAEAPSPLPREVVPRRERAWIEITVVEDFAPAKPLTGGRFRLSLPDGSIREGALNGQASVRIDDIEPGKCWLELEDPATGLEGSTQS